MRRSADETKEKILAAARERFASTGYEGATIRAIAADAGIDPAMVMRYYGNKDKLFAAAANFDLRFPDLTGVGRANVGPALVAHFLDRWEDDEALVILLRSATTNSDAARRMQQIFGEQLEPMVAALAPDDPALRAGLISSQILGLALCRYVLRLPPVVAMSRDEIVDHVGPTISHYLNRIPELRPPGLRPGGTPSPPALTGEQPPSR